MSWHGLIYAFQQDRECAYLLTIFFFFPLRILLVGIETKQSFSPLPSAFSVNQCTSNAYSLCIFLKKKKKEKKKTVSKQRRLILVHLKIILLRHFDVTTKKDINHDLANFTFCENWI